MWDSDEREFHINYIELKAAFLCREESTYSAFCRQQSSTSTFLKWGGRKKQLNALARDIWLWCEERNLWLSVFHIPGIHNIHADQLSRAGKKLKIWNGHLIQTFFMKFKRKWEFVALICLHLLKITNYLFTVHTYQTTRLWQ